MSPRFSGFLLSALASFFVWWLVPGSAIDRAWFWLSTFPIPNAILQNSGDGTRGNPYQLKITSEKAPKFKGGIPTEILITDDPDQIFQSSPPSPVDFAVILNNIQRMGRDSVAIGIPLYWNNPEVIATVALERQLEGIPNLITAAPLSRSPEETAIPSAFLRASIPASKVRGNVALLPKVNRIPVPNIMLGKQKSFAGFTVLESEETGNHPYLMARWGDRIVFSFQLLAALEHLSLNPNSIDILLGQAIKLGPGNHSIPIDEFGRLKFQNSTASRYKINTLAAETLINTPNDRLNKNRFDPVLIRDSQVTNDKFHAQFSKNLAINIALLADPKGNPVIQSFRRFPEGVELLFLAALLMVLTSIMEFCPNKDPRLLFGFIAGSLLILHFIFLFTTNTALPTLPALAATIIATVSYRRKKNRLRRRYLNRFSTKQQSSRLNQSHTSNN